MTELKTLKDIVKLKHCNAKECRDTGIIFPEEAKREAIKYVKQWFSKIEDKEFKFKIIDGRMGVNNVFEMKPLDQQRVASIGAFVSFFNITDEDLK